MFLPHHKKNAVARLKKDISKIGIYQKSIAFQTPVSSLTLYPRFQQCLFLSVTFFVSHALNNNNSRAIVPMLNPAERIKKKANNQSINVYLFCFPLIYFAIEKKS